jgi:hypothetical protein
MKISPLGRGVREGRFRTCPDPFRRATGKGLYKYLGHPSSSEWILERFAVRLSTLVAILVSAMLLFTVGYSSYYAPFAGDEPTVSFKVIADPLGGIDVPVPKILGASIDWTDNANGLYRGAGYLNPLPVGEVIGLQPSHLRFPATGLSQNYNWTYGVGLSGERRANPSHGDKPQTSDFGTNEFYKLVNHTGSEPVMVVNANKDKGGTPQLAADWVSYCNDAQWKGMGKLRAQHGFFSPYRIKHWEIGYDISDPRYWTGPMEPPGAGYEYAKRLKDFSVAMKRVDPDIRVGAWLVLNPDMEQYSADDAWNLNFLAAASTSFLLEGWSSPRYYFDYVVVKVDVPDIGQLLSPDRLFEYSYAKTWQMVRSTLTSDMNTLEGLLEATTPSRPGGIPYAIASFGPDFGNEGWNMETPSFAGSAVITSDLASTFVERSMDGANQNILYACYDELNTKTYKSLMINPDMEESHRDGWSRSPNYHAMDMCAELQEGRLLPITDYDQPTFSTKAEKDLPKVSDVPITSVAVTRRGDTMTMLLLNRDLDRSVDCRITMEGWLGQKDVEVRTLTFDSILSHNLVSNEVTAPSDYDRTGGFQLRVTVPNASVVLIVVLNLGVS